MLTHSRPTGKSAEKCTIPTDRRAPIPSPSSSPGPLEAVGPEVPEEPEGLEEASALKPPNESLLLVLITKTRHSLKRLQSFSHDPGLPAVAVHSQPAEHDLPSTILKTQPNGRIQRNQLPRSLSRRANPRSSILFTK